MSLELCEVNITETDLSSQLLTAESHAIGPSHNPLLIKRMYLKMIR
jgi:hypothetical protein